VVVFSSTGVRCIPFQALQHLGCCRGVDAESLGQLRLRNPLLDRDPVHYVLLADVHANPVQRDVD
jgi:hypothetical protein